MMNGNVSDLTPLRGMKLERLMLWCWSGSDLTPLKGMPLKWLNCGGRGQRLDLTPLVGAPLGSLCINFTQVSDLAPLRSAGSECIADGYLLNPARTRWCSRPRLGPAHGGYAFGLRLARVSSGEARLNPPPFVPLILEAKKLQDDWAAKLKLPVEATNKIGMKLILIPPAGGGAEGLYYLGKYEVTQGDGSRCTDRQFRASVGPHESGQWQKGMPLNSLFIKGVGLTVVGSATN